MKHRYITLLFLVLAVAACGDFDEINRNPNNPGSVPPEMLLPPIISGAAGAMTASGSRAGQYVQHLAWSGGTSEGDGRYNLTGASWREEWNGAVRLIKDVNQLKEIAIATDQPQYEAVARVCKAYILSLVADAFGDIPYDEAGMGNLPGLEFPRFQHQQEVYDHALGDLDSANHLLAALPAGATVRRDILFNGNPAAWRKFANSLQLRLLMRQSARVDVKARVAAIFDNPAGYPLFTGVEDQAVLHYNNETDVYRWYLTNPPADGSGVNFNDNARVSDVLVDLLKRDDDPRLVVHAAPTRASWMAGGALEYRGQPAGLSTAEQDELYASTGLTFDDFSVLGKRHRVENRAFLMTHAELLLIKAEAITRGMIAGDAAAAYRDAIVASFDKWPPRDDAPGITGAMKAAYFARPAVALDPARALVQIAEQAWIDAFLNGFEGWSSWRRTGVPAIAPGPSVLSPVPVRYVYSDNEQNNPGLLRWVKENMGGTMPDHNVKVWFQP
ncbi:MAG: SusD/RagB family nutrient-binding outer membrane lipoprotein [Odoribacteraceae bacterium]|nr:SusD/RagB family nutrient-binding outer membrane lipoprotein [Odoribacteraceae bacterium]